VLRTAPLPDSRRSQIRSCHTPSGENSFLVTYARVVSATPPPPSTPSEPETTPEEYRQRALLLADLGRYDEAAGEIAAGLEAAPDDAALLATLARVHLAADQPAEALVAAERAVAAAPDTINPLVVRAMALTDSTRFADAAQVAGDILERWPDDPFAQRTGAALLSESRNGQEALNAAWHSVRIAPDEAEAHLVLAVVAARLRLFDLAQRAYAEALDLDSKIGDAQSDVGIVRLERRRWARALEELADDAALGSPPAADPPTAEPPPGAAYPSPFPRPYRMPDTSDTAAVDGADEDTTPRTSSTSGFFGGAARNRRSSDRNQRSSDRDQDADLEGRAGRADRPGAPDGAGPAGGDPPTADQDRDCGARHGTGGDSGRADPPAINPPSGPVLDPSADSAAAVRQAVLYGANGTLVAAVLIAGMTLVSSGASRVWSGMIGVLILAAVLIWLARRLREPIASALSRLRTADRRLTVAAYGTFIAPAGLVAYAVIGGPVPLVAAMVLAVLAELLVLVRR
jgi:Flp pilus assembly protein TadD